MAQVKNFDVDQGAQKTFKVTYPGYDLTTRGAIQMDARSDFLDNAPGAPLFSLTVGDGLTIGGVGNDELTVVISDARSALMTLARYRYDIELENPKKRLIQGYLNVSKQTTD